MLVCGFFSDISTDSRRRLILAARECDEARVRDEVVLVWEDAMRVQDVRGASCIYERSGSAGTSELVMIREGERTSAAQLRSAPQLSKLGELLSLRQTAEECAYWRGLAPAMQTS